MKKHLIKILMIFFLLGAAAPEMPAQCPMCKIGAESNLKNGGTAANGLNTGILYMLSLPYLLVGTVGFIWWKNRNREEEEEV